MKITDIELIPLSVKQLEATPAATVPVLEELGGDKRRITKIQLRGN